MTAHFSLAHAFAAVATTVALGTAATNVGAQTALDFGPASEWIFIGDAGRPASQNPSNAWYATAVTYYAPGGVLATTAAAAFEDDLPFAAGGTNMTGVEPVAAGLVLETAFGLAPGALDPVLVDEVELHAARGHGVPAPGVRTGRPAATQPFHPPSSDQTLR